MADSISKSIAKTITWRITGLIITFLIAYSITDSLKWGSTIAVFDLFIKSFFYFVHERIWTKVK